jgi:hypothetical protein
MSDALSTNTIKNFIEYLNYLSMREFYGEINIKMERGKIVLGEQRGKIKFDNDNYLRYKKKSF